MQALRAGYNLVEEDFLGDRFERFGETMSIVEFLRHLRQGKPLPAKLRIVGLGHLLYWAEGQELYIYIRKLFSDAADQLMRRNPILQFPVQQLSMGPEAKLTIKGKEVRLQPLFADRLKPQTVGWWHAPFNIP